MPTSRSDKHTESSVQQIIYADVTSNLDVHPDLGDLFRITNSNDIKSAVRHLILTNKYERFYQPNCGGNITHDLFENFTVETQHMITAAITDTITNYEPRVNLLEILVNPQPDQNGVNITIVFSIATVAEVQTLTIFIERVR